MNNCCEKIPGISVRIKLFYFRQGDHIKSVLEKNQSVVEAFEMHYRDLLNAHTPFLHGACENFEKIVLVLRGSTTVKLVHVEPNEVFIHGPKEVMQELIKQGVAEALLEPFYFSYDDDGEE